MTLSEKNWTIVVILSIIFIIAALVIVFVFGAKHWRCQGGACKWIFSGDYMSKDRCETNCEGYVLQESDLNPSETAMGWDCVWNDSKSAWEVQQRPGGYFASKQIAEDLCPGYACYQDDAGN